MTRNHVLAPSGSRQTARESNYGRCRRARLLRGLLALPIALILAFAPAAPTLAAGTTGKEGLSGYKHEETKKETKTPVPKKEEEHEQVKEEPVAKASTLPFTGFDLRWTVGFGVLLVGVGGSIVLMQRRGRDAGR